MLKVLPKDQFINVLLSYKIRLHIRLRYEYELARQQAGQLVQETQFGAKISLSRHQKK